MLGAYVRHNEDPPKPKVKNKKIIFRPENWKWDDFDDMCSHMKRIVCKIRSDGYCLLNAVKDSLLHDYDNLVTLRKMKEEITKYLCERNEKFLQYHTGNANSMVHEVQEFFESGRFITSEVCDFLVSVIAEVFNLTIHVYQRKTDGMFKFTHFLQKTLKKKFT